MFPAATIYAAKAVDDARLDYQPRDEDDAEYIEPGPAWPMRMVPVVVEFTLLTGLVGAFLHWSIGVSGLLSLVIAWAWIGLGCVVVRFARRRAERRAAT
jgi:hypothetical protein